MRTALDMGVTVIFAHCSLPFWGEFDTKYLDDLEDFYKLFEEAKNNDWKIYADLSAVATPLRAPYMPKIIDKIPHERILYGSDYPIPASEFSHSRTKNICEWIQLIWQAIQIKNPLDKNYKLISKMGFDEKIFTNADDLFAEIVY